jgi:zinc protease
VNVAQEGAAQGEVRVAGIGMARDSGDWVPGVVANYVLGGSTITGRLGSNLREEKGWTYGVRSGFAAGVRPAGWTVETAVGAEVTAEAISEIQGELRRMVDEPVSADELTRARDSLILSLPRAFETPMRIVSRLATAEAFGLEPDYWSTFADRVRRVTVDQVQEMSRRYFDPENTVKVAVGPRIE